MTEPPDDDLPPRTEQIPIPPSRRQLTPPEPTAADQAAPPSAEPSADEGDHQAPPAAQAWAAGGPTLLFGRRPDPSAAAPLHPYPASSDPGSGSDGASCR